MKAAPIVFLHLLKTAGNAFNRYLEMAFELDEVVNSLGNDPSADAELKRHMQMTEAQRRRVRVIFGHHPKAFSALYPKSPRMTIVREPFERALSQYIYERHNAAALGLDEEDRPLPEEITLKQFMNYFLHWGSSSNATNITLQTRRSAFDLQTRGVAEFLDVDASNLTADDVPALVHQFKFIGIQDQLSLSIFLLSREFDLPLHAVPIAYSFSELTKRYFPPAFIREVHESRPLDGKLYNIAKANFEKLADRHLSRRSDWDAWNAFREQAELEVRGSLARKFSLDAIRQSEAESVPKPDFQTTVGVASIQGVSGAISIDKTLTMHGNTLGVASKKSGKYIEAITSSESAITLENGAALNVASRILPAGNWEVWATATFTGEVSTALQYIMAGISSTSEEFDGTPGRLSDVPYGLEGKAVLFKGNRPTVSILTTRFSLSKPTVIYLIARSEFKGGSVKAYGILSARRMD